AWALVWQNIILASVKTAILWITGHWRPSICFSRQSLRKIRNVGLSIFSSSLLNTISLNIYNFVIGAFYNISSLGVYTQADKWSKMGSASMSQILTSSFVPLLSKVQDSPQTFHRYVEKTARFTSFILLPAMALLAVMAAPIFHLLFGTKWDAAIPLFSILSVRGIFIVLISLYSNYLLALGKAGNLFLSEAIKDGLIFIAILATIFLRDITWLIIGQLAASVATWGILLPVTARPMNLSPAALLRPMIPFATATLAATAAAAGILLATPNILPLDPLAPDLTQRIVANALILTLQTLAGGGLYLLILRVSGVKELPEAKEYLLGRFRTKC
ncbi:MAG: oligosaccharide flippase family protein, partial [Muribaculaceae bacterium]|nr:oligosaccharide flippase family protein [Muribaculaceae bacterium]